MDRSLDLPVEEFQERVRRAQARMAELDVSVLLTTHLDNIFYLSGYRSWLRSSQHRPFALALARSGEPRLILPTLEEGNANLTSWVTDVKSWQATDDYVALYRDAVVEMGGGTATVAVEMGDDQWLGMPLYQWQRLQTLLPTAKFTSAADLMWDLRVLKSPREIGYLRKAAQICDSAVAAAWGTLRVGVTEKEVARAVGTEMLASGADAIAFVVVKSGFDAHSAGNKYATDRVIERGDLVTTDIGCYYHGYASDMQRNASLGPPLAEHRRAQETALAMNRACLAEVRAGVPIRKVDDARLRFLRENKLPIPPYAGVGHSIGISFHELPRIGPEGEGILQAGMAICVEPAIRISPWGGVSVEDMVVVTDTGYDFLTNSPRELFVAD